MSPFPILLKTTTNNNKTQVELAPEEVQLIVNSLAYDMKIEEVRGGILGSLGVRCVALRCITHPD